MYKKSVEKVFSFFWPFNQHTFQKDGSDQNIKATGIFIILPQLCVYYGHNYRVKTPSRKNAQVTRDGDIYQLN